jgi:thiol:disulfide interchange protein DsbD
MERMRDLMMPLLLRLTALLAVGVSLFGGGAASAAADQALVRTEHVTARLLAERPVVSPGEALDLALVFDLAPGWHTYWRNPGDSGEPPRVEWTLPDGPIVGPIRWPWPSLIRVGPLANYGYSGQAVHLFRLRVPSDWPVGEPLTIAADAHWLVCEEACIPEQGRFSFQLDVVDHPPVVPDVQADGSQIFAEARRRLPVSEPILGRLRAEDGRLWLGVPTERLPETLTGAWFFAGRWGLIDHAADQPRRLEDGTLTLELTPGEASADHLEGVLVVDSGDRARAFRVEAQLAGNGSALGQPSADAETRLALPSALLFAVLGGLILNLMPCVFPVLAIKALGLARQAGASRSARLAHGLFYTAGVLTFFALVAGLLLVLRAAGAAIGWGFQLQSPVFVALMAYLFLVLGLALAGGLTLGTRLMGIAGAAGVPADRGHHGAFITGGLAALVAAPCTAPFMGAALGYALVQPWYIALAVMLALGLGLALPFLLLALAPGFAARLPRPGAWMEVLKQVLAFPLFATAAWLAWVLSVQTGSTGIGSLLAGAVTLVFGLWLLERGRGVGGGWLLLTRVLGFASLAAALGLAIGTARLDSAPVEAAATDGLQAEPWSPARLAEIRAEGRPVLVNMTAAWCITCLVNERVALDTDAVTEAMSAADVRYLKGDWTNRDPAITDYLAGFGRSGVPIYVLYPAHGSPRVLPQLLTEQIVLDALSTLDESRSAGG